MNVYTQLFKILYNGRVLESKIDDYQQATIIRAYYAKQFRVKAHVFKIVPHTTQIKLSPELSERVLNASNEEKEQLKHLKIISGRHLKDKALKTFNESKYTPTEYQPKEIRFAQSAERSKGLSTIAHLKDKRTKQSNIHDVSTFKWMDNYEQKNLSLELPDRFDYINKIKDKYNKYNDLFKHVRHVFSLSNNDTKKLLSTIQL